MHFLPLDSAVLTLMERNFEKQALYRAPEVLRSTDPRDKSSDIWSLGLLFWRILSNEEPEAESEVSDPMARRVSRIISCKGAKGRYVGVSEESWEQKMEEVQKAVIDSCLLVDPLARPTSRELVNRLENLIRKSVDEIPIFVQKLWMDFESQNVVNRFSAPLSSLLDLIRLELPSLGGIATEYGEEKIIRCVTRCLIANGEQTEKLSLFRFATFFHVFSHLGTTKLADSLKYFLECAKLPYFFGLLTPIETQEAIEKLEANQFLVCYHVETSVESRLELFVKREDLSTEGPIPIIKYDGSLDVTLGNETTFAARLETLIKGATSPKHMPPTSKSPLSLVLSALEQTIK